MTQFSYTAITPRGERETSSIEAIDQSDAARKLLKKGLTPIEIKAGSAKLPAFFESFSSVKTQLVAEFTEKLSILLNSHFPLEKALLISANLCEDPRLKGIISTLAKDLKEGQSFSDALQQHPAAFDSIYISIVKAGEESGKLAALLEELANHLTEAQRMRQETRSALAYPIILLLVGVLSIATMIGYVVPQFATVFEGGNNAIPEGTQFLFSLSDVVQSYWWLAFAFPAGCWLLWKLAFMDDNLAIQIDRSRFSWPIAGRLVSLLEYGKIAQTLSVLLQNGVSIVYALELSEGVTSNRYLQAGLKQVKQDVGRGKPLSSTLREHLNPPSLFSEFVALGEESGQIASLLAKIADTFANEARQALRKLIALIEPVVILIMGAVIGLIVISMLSAVFSMTDIAV